MPEMTVRARDRTTRRIACKGWKCRSDPMPVTALMTREMSGHRM